MSKSLALYAFEALVSKLDHLPPRGLQDFDFAAKPDTPKIPAKAPLFVTWNKQKQLRGCIGTFSDIDIEAGVRRYALISAFEDSRFSPIKKAELPLLSVSITLLDNFIPIKDPYDWDIGKHGLKVSISNKGRHYSGTFLPIVAEEQEWDKEETLWNLLRKAGLPGIAASNTHDFYCSSISSGDMTLVRYEGLKCEATYKEYMDAKGSK